MRPIRWLLTVGPMSDALWVYVPAMIAQKGLGFARVLALMFLMGRSERAVAEYGLWGVALAAFQVVAPLMSLGTHGALTRYVSHYEARRQLRPMARRTVLLVTALVAVVLSGVLAGRAVLGPMVFAVSRPVSAEVASVPDWRQAVLFTWAMVNAALLCLHMNVVGYLYGLRAYRAVSGLEMLFNIVFTGFAITAALNCPSAEALLAAHASCVAVTLACGVVLAAGMTGGDRSGERATPRERPTEAHTEGDADSTTDTLGRLAARLVRYGSLSVTGDLAWLAMIYAGLWLTNRRFGPTEAGVFGGMLLLAQAVLFVANAAWSVGFTHAASQWEKGDRAGAVARLETLYKTVVLGIGTLAVLAVATRNGWAGWLPDRFSAGKDLLPGMLVMFQAAVCLSLVQMLARLQERPWVVAVMAGGAMATLAGLDVAIGPSSAREIAWVHGLAFLGGGGLVATGYLRRAGPRLGAGTWVCLFSPAILLGICWREGGTWLTIGLWTAVLTTSLLSGAIFSGDEKRRIVEAVRRRIRSRRPGGS